MTAYRVYHEITCPPRPHHTVSSSIECGNAMTDDPRLDLQHAAEGESAGDLVATLPAPVAAYIQATNACDLNALLATFVDDALVNDQLRDYWGKEAIAAWAARDIIGERMTLKVTNIIQHYDHSIVTAHVDGSFDKRGLPDPLVLAFYFSSYNGKIVQLIMLRNQSGT
jgi:ketosteroid isomerase-like protein